MSSRNKSFYCLVVFDIASSISGTRSCSFGSLCQFVDGPCQRYVVLTDIASRQPVTEEVMEDEPNGVQAANRSRGFKEVAVSEGGIP